MNRVFFTNQPAVFSWFIADFVACCSFFHGSILKTATENTLKKSFQLISGFLILPYFSAGHKNAAVGCRRQRNC